jgi:hypothetical protein
MCQRRGIIAPAPAIKFATSGSEVSDVVNSVNARNFFQEANMANRKTYRTVGSARIGFVALVATILTAGISGDAAAAIHKGRLHARSPILESHAQLVEQTPVQSGTMRYYGGPKSPMWREVR